MSLTSSPLSVATAAFMWTSLAWSTVPGPAGPGAVLWTRPRSLCRGPRISGMT